MKNNKGIFLVIVIGLLLMISTAIIGLIFVLNTRVRQHEQGIDRSTAYYLCETGLSFAQINFSTGHIPLNNLPYEDTYYFQMGDKTYDIHYKLERDQGEYVFTSWVVSPFGLGKTYRLYMRGTTGFPIFIRGKP